MNVIRTTLIVAAAAAGLLVTIAAADGCAQVRESRFDFEEDWTGAVPAGWFVPTAGYVAGVVEEGGQAREALRSAWSRRWAPR